MAFAVRRKPFAVAAAALAVVAGYVAWDWLTLSPEEGINAALDRGVQALAEKDADKLLADVARDYNDGGLDRDDLAALARAFFARYGPVRVWLRGRRVTVSGSAAVAEFGAYSLPDLPKMRGASPQKAHSEWCIAFVRNKGRWVIDRITPLTVRGEQATSLKRLAGRLGVRPGRP